MPSTVNCEEEQASSVAEMKVAIAADHAGMPLRRVVVEAVEAAGGDPVVLDLPNAGDSDDYPDVARMVARAIATGEVTRGVLLCGSGAGVAIAANKFPLVRAASVQDTYTAHQMVEHDDANVLAIGARVIGPETAAELVGAFIRASFSKAPRHSRRLGKILDIERESYVKNLPEQLRKREQSIWLRGLDRRMISDGDLAFMLARWGVSGLLPDVLLVAEAISTADTYNDLLLSLLSEGIVEAGELSVAVVHSDLLVGAELLGSVFDATSGTDGYVSVPLPMVSTSGSSPAALPLLLKQIKDLPAKTTRSNVLLEVPATKEGCVMVEELTASGVGINAIMVVHGDHYLQVVSAYSRGLERRLQNGLDLGIPLVVSVAVSTEDQRSSVDQVDEIREHWHRWLATDHWKRLATQGGVTPRLAWAFPPSMSSATDSSWIPLLDETLLEHLTVPSSILQVGKDDLDLLFNVGHRRGVLSARKPQPPSTSNNESVLGSEPVNEPVGYTPGGGAEDMLQRQLLDRSVHQWDILIRAVESKASGLRRQEG